MSLIGISAISMTDNGHQERGTDLPHPTQAGSLRFWIRCHLGAEDDREMSQER